jgi:hypothetical protein
MGEVLSIFAIAVLMVLIVVSLRRQRALAANDEAQARTRIGYDEAQHERSMQRRAESKAAQPE